MSLTTLLTQQDVCSLLRKTFKFKPVSIDGPIKALPVTNDHATIGAAFDYLARFWLERHHKVVYSRPWVAEQSANILSVSGEEYVLGKFGGEERLIQKTEWLELFICNGPQACGYARGNWTAGLLARRIMNCLGGKCGASGLPGLVSQMGYSVRKPQPVPYNSASPEEQAEFREATRRDQMEYRKRGYKVLCFDACAKTDSPSARRGIRTRGGSDTVSTNHSKKSIRCRGCWGGDAGSSDVQQDLQFRRHLTHRAIQNKALIIGLGPQNRLNPPQFCAPPG